jgi:hypothetical protein
MRTALVALAILAAASPVSADVEILTQHGNMETSASSACPEDPEPEPDFLKFFENHVLGVQISILSTMPSACGEAAMGASLEVLLDGQSAIQGAFGISSSLDSHGGGYSSLGAGLQIRVDRPVSYSLSCAGTTTESGDPDGGGMEFFFRGRSIDHTTAGEGEFDHLWTGTLEPGVVYSISMNAAASRSSRQLPGGSFLFMDGSTNQTAEFRLQFDDQIVDVAGTSVGKLKSHY